MARTRCACRSRVGHGPHALCLSLSHWPRGRNPARVGILGGVSLRHCLSPRETIPIRPVAGVPRVGSEAVRGPGRGGPSAHAQVLRRGVGGAHAQAPASIVPHPPALSPAFIACRQECLPACGWAGWLPKRIGSFACRSPFACRHESLSAKGGFPFGVPGEMGSGESRRNGVPLGRRNGVSLGRRRPIRRHESLSACPLL